MQLHSPANKKMNYQFSNTERQFVGLGPIQPDWEYVEFEGDHYSPDSILVFEGETIKRHIISTETSYQEFREYPIIGNFEIPKNEIDFPISYGMVLNASSQVYLQWGIIHKQKPLRLYNKHLSGINELVSEKSPSYNISNPYSKNGVGFQLDINKQTILDCINQNSNTPYWNQNIFGMKRDLRNPMNIGVRKELFDVFNIDECEYFLE
ncbi:MAG: hypothetical protein R2795_05795 [Saprospiraceae bacterium]